MEKQHVSSPSAAEWLDKATNLKEEMLSRLESMPQAQRTQTPPSGNKSAYGVVVDLVEFEERIAGEWRQKLLKLSPLMLRFKCSKLSGVISLIRIMIVSEAPSSRKMEPQGVIDLDKLRERWDSARDRLVSEIPDNPESLWILHPVMGPITSERTGRMIVSRLERHLRRWPGTIGD